MTAYDRSKVLTISSLNTFKKCPYAFYLEFIAGVETQVSPEARRGTYIHGFLAEYLLGGDCGQLTGEILQHCPPEDVGELDAILTYIWNRYGDPPALLPESAETMGTEMPFALDVDGELCTTDDEGAAFAGTMDVVYMDGNIPVVRDWKTGRNVDTEPLEQDPQMGIYGYALSQMFPDAPTIRLERDYLRYEYGLQTAEVSRDDLAPAWNRTVAMARGPLDALELLGKGIDPQGASPARTGPLCGWCGARAHCPRWGDALTLYHGDGDLTAPGNALKLARALRITRQRITEAESRLREYVVENGALEDPDTGEILDLHPSTRPEVDTRAMVKILMDHGISKDDILEAMKITKSAAYGLAKGRDEKAKALRKALKDAITQKPSPRFEWRK